MFVIVIHIRTIQIFQKFVLFTRNFVHFEHTHELGHSHNKRFKKINFRHSFGTQKSLQQQLFIPYVSFFLAPNKSENFISQKKRIGSLTQSHVCSDCGLPLQAHQLILYAVGTVSGESRRKNYLGRLVGRCISAKFSKLRDPGYRD